MVPFRALFVCLTVAPLLSLSLPLPKCPTTGLSLPCREPPDQDLQSQENILPREAGWEDAYYVEGTFSLKEKDVPSGPINEGRRLTAILGIYGKTHSENETEILRERLGYVLTSRTHEKINVLLNQAWTAPSVKARQDSLAAAAEVADEDAPPLDPSRPRPPPRQLPAGGGGSRPLPLPPPPSLERKRKRDTDKPRPKQGNESHPPSRKPKRKRDDKPPRPRTHVNFWKRFGTSGGPVSSDDILDVLYAPSRPPKSSGVAPSPSMVRPSEKPPFPPRHAPVGDQHYSGGNTQAGPSRQPSHSSAHPSSDRPPMIHEPPQSQPPVTFGTNGVPGQVYSAAPGLPHQMGSYGHLTPSQAEIPGPMGYDRQTGLPVYPAGNWIGKTHSGSGSLPASVQPTTQYSYPTAQGYAVHTRVPGQASLPSQSQAQRPPANPDPWDSYFEGNNGGHPGYGGNP